MDDGARLVMISCSDHHDVLVGALWTLFSSQHGVDFDLQWGGRSVRAHRLVAEAFLSPAKLCASDTTAQHSEARHQVDYNGYGFHSHPEDANDTLDCLLEFVYRGRTTVREDHLERLLEAAREFDFQMLVDAVEETRKASSVATRTADPDNTGRRQRKGKPVKLVAESRVKDNYQPTVKRKSPRVSRSRKKIRNCTTQEIDGSCDDSDSPLDDAGTDTAAAEPSFLRCTHCSYKTRRKHFYDVHQAQHDPSIEVFTCATCQMRFLCRDSLERHLAVHSGAIHLFECAHCPNKFRKKSAFDVHQAKHDSSIAVFRCDLCCQKFLSKGSLERHRLGHKGYKCPHCDFVAQKRWNYENHLFSVHEVNCSGKPLAKIKCPECDFSCVYEARLRYHVVAKHSGQRPFRCDHGGCDFASGTKSDVKKHFKAVHLKIRPFLCDSCGFCTVSQSQLDKHKRSHSGLKPHSCDICNKSYASVYTLKEHIRMHTTHEKPHICHMCGRRYTRREHLNRHLKNLHKVPAATSIAITTTTTAIITATATMSSSSMAPPINETIASEPTATQFLPWAAPSSTAALRAVPDAGDSPNLHCSYGTIGLQRAYM